MGYDWTMTDPTQPPADGEHPPTTTQPDATAQDPAAAPPPPPAPERGAPAPASPKGDPLRGSRTSGVWASVIALGLVLLLLVVFVAQNTQDVNVSFLGWDGRTPLAVALLIATTAGLFLAAVAGSLRILQLRRRVKRGTAA